jgi:DNA-binding transcriptional ArsR family regulator
MTGTNATSHQRANPLRTAAEPRRLQILELLWDREMSVGEITDMVPVTMGAVSQHLSKLKAAGLVSVRPDGRRRLYRATKQDLGALAVVLEAYWTDRLGDLGGLARSLEATDRPPPATAEPRTSPGDPS